MQNQKIFRNLFKFVLPFFILFAGAIQANESSNSEKQIGFALKAKPKKLILPTVMTVHGQSDLYFGENPKKLIRVGQILGEQSRIVTPMEGDVTIDWDGGRRLTVLAGSEVLIPQVAPDSGEAKIIRLLRGSLRWQGPLQQTPKYTVVLESGLSLLELPNGDFVFTYDFEKAQFTGKVYSGELEFRAMNAETAVTLRKNQKATFQGILESGELAYDVLLHGRKIPRGKMLSQELMKGAEAEIFSEENEAKREQQRVKKVLAEKAARKAYLDSLQCQKPLGRLNECSWSCETGKGVLLKGKPKAFRCVGVGVNCVRRRCDANGKWVDAHILSGESARLVCLRPQDVKACDY